MKSLHSISVESYLMNEHVAQKDLNYTTLGFAGKKTLEKIRPKRSQKAHLKEFRPKNGAKSPGMQNVVRFFAQHLRSSNARSQLRDVASLLRPSRP